MELLALRAPPFLLRLAGASPSRLYSLLYSAGENHARCEIFCDAPYDADISGSAASQPLRLAAFSTWRRQTISLCRVWRLGRFHGRGLPMNWRPSTTSAARGCRPRRSALRGPPRRERTRPAADCRARAAQPEPAPDAALGRLPVKPASSRGAVPVRLQGRSRQDRAVATGGLGLEQGRVGAADEIPGRNGLGGGRNAE